MKWVKIISVFLFAAFYQAVSFAQFTTGDNGQFSFSALAEEEKMARDVYIALAEKWDIPVFLNIQKAEEVHLQEVIKLVQQRGLDLPKSVIKNEKGVFDSPRFQKLYSNLVMEGSASLVAALKVGALIEEMDITDLKAGLEVEIDEKETALLNRLMNASENHLRAFHRNLQAQGVDYQPSVMDKASFESIIQGEKAMNCAGGGQMGKGKMGKGKMKGCMGTCCKSSK